MLTQDDIDKTRTNLTHVKDILKVIIDDLDKGSVDQGLHYVLCQAIQNTIDTATIASMILINIEEEKVYE